MSKIDLIPRKLSKVNIDNAIIEYKKLLEDIPLTIEVKSLFELMNILKRKKINKGPYHNVTIFECANRIMTDLVVLYGVRMLLNGEIKEIDFKEYDVEFGIENKNSHDITANYKIKNLKCEVFNVAGSFFQTKKVKTLKKLRKDKKENDIIMIMYNKDAVPKNYKAKPNTGEYFLPVEIEDF